MDRETRRSAGRRRRVALVLALMTTATGLVWRMAPLHLGRFAWKYGGSALYATLLYWLLAASLPRARRAVLAAASFGLAVAIELLKLVHAPALDRFRATLAGRLTLGQVFSVEAIVAYGVGIGVVFAADLLWPRKRL